MNLFSSIRWQWLIPGLLLLTVAGVLLFHQLDDQAVTDVSAWTTADAYPSVVEGPLQQEHESCRGCHADIVKEWESSQHAGACRRIDPTVDLPAFHPPQEVIEGSITTRVYQLEGNLVVETLSPEGTNRVYNAEGVLAIEPLRQFMLPVGNGRYQMTEAAYDPHHGDWFNVYEGEERLPHEWGSWAGRGMTWNAMCAYCHTTTLEKGYDADTDTYHTTWDALGISCRQCHGTIGNECEGEKGPPEDLKLNANQYMDSCATCHTRRGELTGQFKPGDKFYDHYRPTLVNEPGVYHADGQILHEDFEYGSFIMSSMHDAGVTCLDCHNPHSGKSKLPIENNAICMQCHAPPGVNGAPPIMPTEHSHHAPDSMGNRCVECHMAETTYMVRDPRRDHGFISPDPLLTKELGIPNSCNRCHQKEEETVDWALDWVNKWYGEDMQPRRRARARLVVRAQEMDDTVWPELLAMSGSETNAAWRHSLLLLLGPWVAEPEVMRFAYENLEDTSPLVRTAAVEILTPLPRASMRIRGMLQDSNRMVRLTAAWAVRTGLDRDSEVYRELRTQLDYLSDQPRGAMRQAELAIDEQRFDDAATWLKRAESWDERNGMVKQVIGVMMEQMGRGDESEKYLLAAMELDPNDPNNPYYLGLLYGGRKDYDKTASYLSKAVELAPDYHRAWYNLGLTLVAQEKNNEAVTALKRAMEEAPDQPDYPYALATVLLQTGNARQAAEAAQRALEINPGYTPATQLLMRLQQQQQSGRSYLLP